MHIQMLCATMGLLTTPSFILHANGDDHLKKHKYLISGKLTIPVTFPVYAINREAALLYAIESLNRNNITALHGTIHTSDKEFPLVAKNVVLEWI